MSTEHCRTLVLLAATAGAILCWWPMTARQTSPFDLVSTSSDPNGLLLNPFWSVQVSNPGTVADPAVCGGRPWVAPCTSQQTWIDNSWKCSANGLLGGHANWMAATYSGHVFWNSHSAPGADDDYNIDLHRDDHAGLTAGAERSSSLGDAPVLHMEFDSDETIDHFHTSWWKAFHQAVDNSKAAAQSKIDGKFAIAIGLLGLDYAHGGGTELHPIYALAIRDQDSLTEDRWAIFARNWGNEGYCSSGSEYWNTERVSFLLPRAAALDVSVTGAEFRFGPDDLGAADKAKVSGPDVALVRGQGALVTFTLPGPQSGARINGVLTLRWRTEIPSAVLTSVPEHTRSVIAAEQRHSNHPRAAVLIEPEARAAEAFRKLTPRQRALYRKLVPDPPPPRPDMGILTVRRVPDIASVSLTKRASITNVADSRREDLERRRAAALQEALKIVR